LQDRVEIERLGFATIRLLDRRLKLLPQPFKIGLVRPKLRKCTFERRVSASGEESLVEEQVEGIPLDREIRTHSLSPKQLDNSATPPP
jgi:hypothetical protein